MRLASRAALLDPEEMMTRKEILARYRHLRAIGNSLHEAALDLASHETMLGNARRLGLAYRNELVADSDEELSLTFDLCVYTARSGRSRALDRYARANPPVPGSDEAQVLQAMRNARFSIWCVARRHETAGLVMADVLRDAEQWVMDENLEASAPDGLVFAGRIFTPDIFGMTSGVFVPVDPGLMEDVAEDTLAWRCGSVEETAQDPRFAISVYRTAIENGLLERVHYQ